MITIFIHILFILLYPLNNPFTLKSTNTSFSFTLKKSILLTLTFLSCCKTIFLKLTTKNFSAYLPINFELNQKLSVFLLKFIKRKGIFSPYIRLGSQVRVKKTAGFFDHAKSPAAFYIGATLFLWMTIPQFEGWETLQHPMELLRYFPTTDGASSFIMKKRPISFYC